MAKMSIPGLVFLRCRNGIASRSDHDNSNVSKILPLTTLRTIDLEGKKISGPLFSIFCAKMRVFFEVFSAPEYVQQEGGLGYQFKV
jgi:hypothetical protein